MTLFNALNICYGFVPYDVESAAAVLDLAEQYPEQFNSGEAQRGLAQLSAFLSSHE